MPDPVRILLVSPDLMVASRIGGAASTIGATVETIRGLDVDPPGSGYRVAILDLQGLAGDAGDIIAQARERLAAHGPRPDVGPSLVAFGPHVAVDRLAAARVAGADDVVSRGELLGAFAAVIGPYLR